MLLSAHLFGTAPGAAMYKNQTLKPIEQGETTEAVKEAFLLFQANLDALKRDFLSTQAVKKYTNSFKALQAFGLELLDSKNQRIYEKIIGKMHLVDRIIAGLQYFHDYPMNVTTFDEDARRWVYEIAIDRLIDNKRLIRVFNKFQAANLFLTDKNHRWLFEKIISQAWGSDALFHAFLALREHGIMLSEPKLHWLYLSIINDPRTVEQRVEMVIMLIRSGIDLADDNFQAAMLFYSDRLLKIATIKRGKYMPSILEARQCLSNSGVSFHDESRWLHKKIVERPWHAKQIAWAVSSFEKSGLTFLNKETRWFYKQLVLNSKHAEKIAAVFAELNKAGVVLTDLANASFYQKVMALYAKSHELITLFQNLQIFGFQWTHENIQWLQDKLLPNLKMIDVEKIGQRFQAIKDYGFNFDNEEYRHLYEKIAYRESDAHKMAHIFLTLQTYGLRFDPLHPGFYEFLMDKVRNVWGLVQVVSQLKLQPFDLKNEHHHQLYELLDDNDTYTFPSQDTLAEAIVKLHQGGFAYFDARYRELYTALYEEHWHDYNLVLADNFLVLQYLGLDYLNSENQELYEKAASLRRGKWRNRIEDLRAFSKLWENGSESSHFSDMDKRKLIYRAIDRLNYSGDFDAVAVVDAVNVLHQAGFNLSDHDWLYDLIMGSRKPKDCIEAFCLMRAMGVDVENENTHWVYKRILAGEFSISAAHAFLDLQEAGFDYQNEQHRCLYDVITISHRARDPLLTKAFRALKQANFVVGDPKHQELYLKAKQYPKAVINFFEQTQGIELPGILWSAKENTLACLCIIDQLGIGSDHPRRDSVSVQNYVARFYALHKMGFVCNRAQHWRVYESILQEKPSAADCAINLIKQIYALGINLLDLKYIDLCLKISSDGWLGRVDVQGFEELKELGITSANLEWLFEIYMKYENHPAYWTKFFPTIRELHGLSLKISDETRWIYKDVIGRIAHSNFSLRGLRLLAAYQIPHTQEYRALYREAISQLENCGYSTWIFFEHVVEKASQEIHLDTTPQPTPTKEAEPQLTVTQVTRVPERNPVNAKTDFFKLYANPFLFIQDYHAQTPTGLTIKVIVKMLKTLLSLSKKYAFHPFFPRAHIINGIMYCDLQNEPYREIERLSAFLLKFSDSSDANYDAQEIQALFEPCLNNPALSAWTKKVLEQLLLAMHLSTANTEELTSIQMHSLPLKASNEDFKSLKGLYPITFEAPIEEHIRWIFRTVFAHPYQEQAPIEGIMRVTHGVLHAARAALFIPVFYALCHLYQQFSFSKRLSPDELKLLQITALWHDTGRSKDGADTQESESRSAQNLYYYLTEVLGIDIATATSYKLAIVNKEVKAYCLQHFIAFLLHEVDCIDIIRVKTFSAQYLYFNQAIAKEYTMAFNVMARLITEVRGLTMHSGDHFLVRQYDLMKCFEHEEVWSCLLDLLSFERFSLLKTLYTNGVLGTKTEITALFPERHSDDPNIEAFHSGQLLMRGVRVPSWLYHKKTRLESLADKEIRKMHRRPDEPTRSGRLGKFGNRERSVNLIGAGMETFSDTGFMLRDMPEKDITVCSAQGFMSGYGKKAKDLTSDRLKKYPNLPALFHHMQEGGSGYFYKSYGIELTHNEIIANLSKVSGIVYSESSSFHRRLAFFSHQYEQHPFIPLLQAIFLRYAYAQFYLQKHAEYCTLFGEEKGQQRLYFELGSMSKLPIYRYVSANNQLEQYPEERLSDEHVIQLWVRVFERYFEQCDKSQLIKYDLTDEKQWESIKTAAVYGPTKVHVHGFNDNDIKCASVDSNYPPHLKAQVNQALIDTMQRFAFSPSIL